MASSISSLSRAYYLLHTIPTLVTLLTHRYRYLREASLRRLGMAALVYAVLFGTSIVSVSYLRSIKYHQQTDWRGQAFQSELPHSSEGKSRFKEYLLQALLLPSNRWVGLEGMLAVTSHDQRGYSLFHMGLNEDPRQGVNGLFQKIAKSNYAASEQFTFLTLPGVFAVFAYAGSLPFIFVGMLVLTIVLIAGEHVVWRFTANPFLVSVAGLSTAHVVNQLTFPYLTFVYLCELTLTVVFILLVSKIPTYRVKVVAKQT